MRYREYMNGIRMTSEEKNNMYQAILKKAERKKRTAKTRKIAFAFSMAAVLIVALGVGVFFALNQPVSPTSTPTSTYVLAFSGGYDKTRIPFEIEDFDESGEIAVKIERYADLRSFAEEKNMPFFDENDENYNNAFSQKVREYDEKYFSDRSLIVIIKLEEEYDLERFRDMEIKGEVLTVNLSKPDTDMSYTEISAFVYIIETDKAYVKQVSEIKTNVTSEGKWSDYSGITYFGLVQDDNDRQVEELVRQQVITEEDLNEIYLKSGCEYQDGAWRQVRTPKKEEADPNLLSEEIRFTIIQSIMDEMFENAYKQAEKTGNDKMKEALKKMDVYKYNFLSVDRYYGTYNGCIAVGVEYNISTVSRGFLLIVWRPVLE